MTEVVNSDSLSAISRPAPIEGLSNSRGKHSDSAAESIIQRLPTEIFHLIFSFSTEFPTDVDSTDGETPLCDFVLVCKRWHSILLELPDLWSRIIVDLRYGNSGEEAYTRRIQHQRYVGLQLSIQPRFAVCLVDRGRDDGMHVPIPPHVFYLLKSLRVGRLSVLRELHLIAPLWRMRGLHPLRPHLRALEKLYVCNLTPEVRAEDLGDICVFNGASKLSSFTTVDIQNPTCFFGVQWTQLEYFSAEYRRTTAQSASMLKVLEMGCRLKECLLHMTFGSESLGGDGVPVVTCNTLRSLKLRMSHCGGQHAIRQLFERVRLPSLQSLDVHTCNVHDASIPDISATFSVVTRSIKVSGCPLSHLGYHFADVASVDVVELFRGMPTLTSIHFTLRAGITDTVIDALASISPIIAPRLRVLVFDGKHSFNPESLANTVRVRAEMAPIRVFLRWRQVGDAIHSPL